MLKPIIFFVLLFYYLSALAQNPALAKSYFEKGDLDKAAYEYSLLLKSFPFNETYLLRLIQIYQSQGKYENVGKLLQKQPMKQKPYLWVYLGYNYHLQNADEKAAKYYKKALNAVEKNSFYAYMIGESFKQVYLLDYALKTYQMALQKEPNKTFYLKTALIYAEKNNLELMMQNFLKPLEENTQFLSQIKYYLTRYITTDPENEANRVLKKLLIQNIQKTHQIQWHKLLKWLYIEQKEYKKAFIQLRSLFHKHQASLGEIYHLAQTAAFNKKNETARYIYLFIMQQPKAGRLAESAKLALLNLDLNQILNSEDLTRINQLFQQYLYENWSAKNKIDLYLSYADFLAFHQKQPEKALKILNNLNTQSINKQVEASLRLKEADILLFQQKFNQALVLYTQVQLDFPNHRLGHKATFDIARTSFFQGDMDWAHAQLKVIKSVADDLIANDAIDMDLIIINNKEKGDTLQSGLKTFAKARFEYFRKNPENALAVLDTLTKNFKGQLIYDDACMLKGKILIQQNRNSEALEAFQAVLDNNTEDLLKDDALFQMGKIYEIQGDNDKAMSLFKKIILLYPGSFWLTDAQKHFRKLRGDNLP